MSEDDREREQRERGERVYDLYTRGSALLEAGDFAAATVPLEQARALEPGKTSIREALGRAYFRSGRFEEAREEFAAVVEQAPVNDYAHFCLGKALANTGRRAAARRHARPGRVDAPGPRRLPGVARPAARAALKVAGPALAPSPRAGRTRRTRGLGGPVQPAAARVGRRLQARALVLAHRHRALHDQARARGRSRARPPRPPGRRRAPTPRAPACSRSGPCASGGSTTAASTGRCRRGSRARAPARGPGRRAGPGPRAAASRPPARGRRSRPTRRGPGGASRRGGLPGTRR